MRNFFDFPATAKANGESGVSQNCKEHMPVAMAYVPVQYFGETYDADNALQSGTLYPELNKPFYYCKKRWEESQ